MIKSVATNHRTLQCCAKECMCANTQLYTSCSGVTCVHKQLFPKWYNKGCDYLLIGWYTFVIQKPQYNLHRLSWIPHQKRSSDICCSKCGQCFSNLSLGSRPQEKTVLWNKSSLEGQHVLLQLAQPSNVQHILQHTCQTVLGRCNILLL